MKRNQPPPPTPRSTENEREHAQARTPSPEALYAMVNKKPPQPAKKPEQGVPQAPLRNPRSPQRPPRARDKELNKQPSQGAEVVYASLDFGNRPYKHPRKNQASETIYATVASQGATQPEVLYADVTHKPSQGKHRAREQASETIYAAVAPQSTKPSLTREEIVSMMQASPLVQAYQQEVTHWCGIVYGNSGVLNEKMQEVLQKPGLGEQLSRQVAEHPHSVHRLAGRNMCGFKTGARRQAEEGFQYLCQALDGYADAVTQARENITHVPHAEARRYEQPSEQRTESLQHSHQPERERQPLSNQELLGMVQEHSSVQRYQAQVDYWCGIVFGNSGVLKEKMQDILQKPSQGAELSSQLAAHPQSIHKLAGISACGLKNGTRKHAEAGLEHLCTAVENYADTVQQVKASIARDHQAQTRRNRQEQAVGVKQGLQKDKALSHAKQHGHQAHHHSAETSRQAHQQRPEVPPRKVGGAKAMAFAS
ncbi:BID domain-containing T4SS effector [Bartonella senegalensis]|uniref:BID domain-containing T4SS effector n=1 Tax=Bartonella senegalensis TaxID=1468418 RepID=UPI0002D44A94|nr:BID domain-containing T4SS effector [Bartonella senegalensis]